MSTSNVSNPLNTASNLTLNTPFDRPYFNLILVGMEGGRLLPTGRAIASRISAPFVALDLEIQAREGMSPDEVRALFGIARLRRVEAEMCRDLSLRRGTVIAINSGTLTDSEVRQRLLDSGTALALTCRLDEALRRAYIAQGAHFHDPEVRALTLDRIVRDRRALQTANVPTLDTTRLATDQAVDQALAIWREGDRARVAMPNLPAPR